MTDTKRSPLRFYNPHYYSDYFNMKSDIEYLLHFTHENTSLSDEDIAELLRRLASDTCGL